MLKNSAVHVIGDAHVKHVGDIAYDVDVIRAFSQHSAEDVILNPSDKDG
jgi:hypothetical protein